MFLRCHLSFCPSVHQASTLSPPAGVWTEPLWPGAEHRRDQAGGICPGHSCCVTDHSQTLRCKQTFCLAHRVRGSGLQTGHGRESLSLKCLGPQLGTLPGWVVPLQPWDHPETPFSWDWLPTGLCWGCLLRQLCVTPPLAWTFSECGGPGGGFLTWKARAGETGVHPFDDVASEGMPCHFCSILSVTRESQVHWDFRGGKLDSASQWGRLEVLEGHEI